MTAFVTGFPGFLGSALVDRLVTDTPGEADVTCLVQPKYRSLAEDRTETVEGSYRAPGAIELIDYFDLPTRYDAVKTVEALEDTAVTCLPLHGYLDTLVEFVRANPDAAGGPMA